MILHPLSNLGPAPPVASPSRSSPGKSFASYLEDAQKPGPTQEASPDKPRVANSEGPSIPKSEASSEQSRPQKTKAETKGVEPPAKGIDTVAETVAEALPEGPSSFESEDLGSELLGDSSEVLELETLGKELIVPKEKPRVLPNEERIRSGKSKSIVSPASLMPQDSELGHRIDLEQTVQEHPKESGVSNTPLGPEKEGTLDSPSTQIILGSKKEQALAQIQVIDLRTLEGKRVDRKPKGHRFSEILRGSDPRKAQHLARESSPGRISTESKDVQVPNLVGTTISLDREPEFSISEKIMQNELGSGPANEQGIKTNPWAAVVHRIFGKDLETPEQTRTEQREARILETQALGDLSQRLTAQKMDSVVFGGGLDQGKLVDHLRNAGAFEIVRSAKFILKDNDRGEIKLVLKPERLGEVKIHLTLTDNSIGARILVDNKEVEEAFQQTIEDLKNAFHEQGFETSDFSVEVRDSGHLAETQAKGYDDLNIVHGQIDMAV